MIETIGVDHVAYGCAIQLIITELKKLIALIACSFTQRLILVPVRLDDGLARLLVHLGLLAERALPLNTHGTWNIREYNDS